jgi:Intracellular proteinase inhibitor
MSVNRMAALAALALIAGCASREPSAGPEGPPLLASVKAATFGTDSAVFSLQVTNTTAAPVALDFRTGQEFDFVVLRGTEEVWRWSGDRMFTQALRTDTLAAGETRTYSASWAPLPRAAGEYTVRGLLSARNVQVEQATRFRL